MPCHPARARELLDKGRAVVARRTPFTIRLRDRTRTGSAVDGVQLRVDPGTRGTGIVLTDTKRESRPGEEPRTVRRGLVSVELRHRGRQIHLSMRRRAGYRHRRRSANRRYRAPRFRNRSRSRSPLPPSVQHRVDTVTALARRLSRYAPVSEIHIEVTAFDTHALAVGRTLTGAEYRSGPLTGTTPRLHLLAAYGRACVYCGATGIRLNIDHVEPRSGGGSGRLGNLVLACVPCNQDKGSQAVQDFLATRPARLAALGGRLGAPLRDAGIMNAAGHRLVAALAALGPPVRTWPAARTRTNRTAAGLPKSHTLDALCTGDADGGTDVVVVRVPAQIQVVTATGRGSYARTTPDRFGFPRLTRTRRKRHFGFATGDLVRARIPRGRWAGAWTGRISVRASGKHSLALPDGRIGVSYRHLALLQRADGYAYTSRSEVVD